jgi:hypothetical protein
VRGGANVVRQYFATGYSMNVACSSRQKLSAGDVITAGLPPISFEQIGSRQTKYVTHLQ